MTEVWYAAYGSNLSARRIGFYIRGGRPPGAARWCPGCRNRSDPLEEATLDIPGELAFSGTSKTWGGGVACLDPDTSGSVPTKARLYRITIDQFEDIVAQENWLDPGAIALADERPHRMEIGVGLTYGAVLRVGEIEGLEVITLTKAERGPLRRPSVAYLRFVAEGLVEAFGMSADDVVDYLSDKPGISGEFSRIELADHLRG